MDELNTSSKKGWLFVDLTILGYVSTLAMTGILRDLPIVDVLYVPGLFAYGIQPWSLVPFIGFMLLTMKLKGYREGLLLPLFAAGFYDLTASLLRYPPVSYFMNYVVWSVMLEVPVLILQKLRFSWSLPVYLVSLLSANFVLSLETRYLFECFACMVTFKTLDGKPRVKVSKV